MWFILGLLFSLATHALAPFEVIQNVKILKVLPNNVIMVNRGLEDGILRNDHAKFSSDTVGFSSRGICIRASAEVSYWRIYRVPNASSFSQDYIYTITGLADREIPFPEAQLRGARQDIPEIDDAKKIEPGPNPFEVKRDLPEKLTERDLIKSTTPDKRKLFVEKNLNEDLFKRDLNNYQLSVYASPFTRQTINEGESLTFGFRGANIGTKYRLLTQFEQQQSKMKDPMSGDSVSTRGTTGNAQFIIRSFTPSVSTLSLINYNSQRFGRLATPRSHWQAGPIGFTWHLYESKTWEHFDLSYVPLFDRRDTDVLNANNSLDNEIVTGLRHGVRLALRIRINERVALENLLWVRPFQDFASWKIDGGDLNLHNDLKLVFSMTDNFFLDYNLIYQKDKLWGTLSGLPEDNFINSVNFRYDFNL